MAAMDVDTIPFRPREVDGNSAATILCCNCGTPINGATAAGALCYDCVRLTVDISEGIQRTATLNFCRGCERWLQPPTHWAVAQLESRELLALCLRKLRGLNKFRIVDASFLWTEPHSRRIRVNITIQQEAFEGTILQQSFEVVYSVMYQQCPDCAKSYTANVWRAVVQVRQKVPHKRTFLFLEQLILKHGAHKDAINIKEAHTGLDFFFAQRNHAQKFADFLSAVVPVKTKQSNELISTDIHTSTKSYKFTFSAEIVPICKDDLVCLPSRLAKQGGNISPIVLASRIGTSVNMLDPNTLQTMDVPGNIYWRSPFNSLAGVQDLVEFVVLEIEPTGLVQGRFILADVTVARSADLGLNDTQHYVRTHMGAILHVGDTVMGYHLIGGNFNNKEFEGLESSKGQKDIPEVILVKKAYQRKKTKGRAWRLKRMAREESDMAARKQDQDKMETDYEQFLRDVEEDEDLRQMMQLYKSGDKKPKRKMDGVEATPVETDEVDDAATSAGDEDELPAINVDELAEDLEELEVKD